MSGETLEFEGVVQRAERGFYRVLVSVGAASREILAKLSGRLDQHRIKIVPGDRVRVEVSPYDTTRGRITYRL